MAWVLGVGGNTCSHREIVQTPQTPSEVMIEPGRPELCDNSSTSWPLCSWDFRSLASGMQAILPIHQSWWVWSEPGQWGWWPGRICQHWFTSIARSRNLQSLGGTVSEFLRGQKKSICCWISDMSESINASLITCPLTKRSNGYHQQQLI